MEEQLSQISQVKSSELNQVKELLEQKSGEYDALLEQYRNLEIHYQEKEQIVAINGEKMMEYDDRLQNLSDEIRVKEKEQRQLVQEIDALNQQMGESRMRSATSIANLEKVVQQYQTENERLKVELDTVRAEMDTVRAEMEDNDRTKNRQEIVLLQQQSE